MFLTLLGKMDYKSRKVLGTGNYWRRYPSVGEINHVSLAKIKSSQPCLQRVLA